MTRKRKLDITNDGVEVRYANWMAQLIAVMQPWSLYWIAGRASAKTVQVLAERVQEVAHDCPGAPFAWVADTYSDLHKNVIPSLIDGLSLLGWMPGTHYVINQEPPREWRQRMYNVCTDWKNTMTFYTGFNFTFISLDRAAIGAGRSYVGVFGDEVKYFPEEKFTNLLKAVRGFRVKYGDSVWYRSRTLTTDMPNPNHLGEYDWILKLAKQNDKQRILLALRAGFVYNDTKREYISRLQHYERLKAESRTNAELRKDVSEAERLMQLARRTMLRWEQRWVKTRRGVSFFFISSSYVNADILGEEWFRDEFAEGLEGAACNILSVIPKLEAAQMFYCNLSMRNFYADGFLNDVIDRHPFGWEQDCTVLRYLDPGRPIEAGMDAGNMLSMVFGQQAGHTPPPPPQAAQALLRPLHEQLPPHRRGHGHADQEGHRDRRRRPPHGLDRPTDVPGPGQHLEQPGVPLLPAAAARPAGGAPVPPLDRPAQLPLPEGRDGSDPHQAEDRRARGHHPDSEGEDGRQAPRPPPAQGEHQPDRRAEVPRPPPRGSPHVAGQGRRERGVILLTMDNGQLTMDN